MRYLLPFDQHYDAKKYMITDFITFSEINTVPVNIKMRVKKFKEFSQ